MRDPLITAEQCQAFVNEWVGLIREAGGDPDNPTYTAVRIVRRGAWADAVDQLRAISEVPVEEDVVSETRSWAEKALDRYDASVYSPAEGALEAGAPVATVRNVTPEPLWSGEEFGHTPWGVSG